MRDPARELADRLHLLRLGELRLEALLLADIDEMQHQAALMALEPIEPAEEQHTGLVARALDADLDRARRGAALGGPGEFDREITAIVLKHKADQRLADQCALHRAE